MKVVCTHVNKLQPPPEAVEAATKAGLNLFGEPLYRISWMNRFETMREKYRAVRSRIAPEHFFLEAWEPGPCPSSRGSYVFVDSFVDIDGEGFCMPEPAYVRALIQKYRMLRVLDRDQFVADKEEQEDKKIKDQFNRNYDQIRDHIPRSVGAPTVYGSYTPQHLRR